jgi:Flp pilus assembly pilin Flp
MFRKLFKNRKGAALVEYGLLVGGIALISAGAISLFGHKTSDLIGTMAAIIPGAHADDNSPIISGKLIETAPNASGYIGLDMEGILAGNGKNRLGTNIAGTGSTAALDGMDGLVVEAH